MKLASSLIGLMSPLLQFVTHKNCPRAMRERRQYGKPISAAANDRADAAWPPPFASPLCLGEVADAGEIAGERDGEDVDAMVALVLSEEFFE